MNPESSEIPTAHQFQAEVLDQGNQVLASGVAWRGNGTNWTFQKSLPESEYIEAPLEARVKMGSRTLAVLASLWILWVS